MTLRAATRPATPRAYVTQADLFKAFADPIRMMLLTIIIKTEGTLDVMHLNDKLGQSGVRIEQPTLSHHLTILRHAGLVSYTKDRNHSYYQVERGRLDEAKACIGALEEVIN